jgi:glutamate-1-semialdehyde 2,1-aminomutase
MAIVTALAVIQRTKILVFREAYHGGVLVFTGGGSPINVPFDYVLADFNEVESTAALIRQHGHDLAAVIVEPILGAGGNIPGTAEFLSMLRTETERVGALLVFDEVKTSRCGAGGMQGLTGIRPDLTTLGKYLGGGLSTGAFGGRKEIMARYDHRAEKAFKHAGTFNNNICSMMAVYAALTKVSVAVGHA